MSDSDATVPVSKHPPDAPPSKEDGSVSPSGIHDLLGGAPSPVTRSDVRHWQPPSAEALRCALPQYEVKAFVARGGMGAVYRGTQKALDREVAIKIMPLEIERDDFHFADRFKSEAKAMAKLSHPNIVAVHDAGETADGLLFFVMEFIEGTDVQQLIEKDGKVEPQRALEITCAVLDALAFAHEGGIIHRDIKPSNIMLDAKCRVKVADFGLAKNLSSESDGFTRSDVMLGTADFISPEASIPGIKLDARADVYAVGVMLYVMLTGKIPRGRFEMPTAVLPKIDPRLDAIVDKAMQTDRDKRYASAAEMKAAVEKVIAETHTGAMPRATAPAAKPKSARVPVVVSAVVVIAAASFFVFKKPASVVKPEVASPPAAKPAEAANETWTDAVPELLKTNSNKSQQTPEGLRIAGGAGFGPVLRDAALRVTLPRIESTVGISVRSTGKKVGDKFEQYTAHFFMPGSVGLTRYGLKAAPDVQFALVPLPGFDPKTRHTLELRAAGDRLSVLVDGKVQIEQRDANFGEGKFAITGYDNVFEKVEYARLDGGSTAAPAAKPWQNLLRDPTKLKFYNDVKQTAEGLRIGEGSNVVTVQQTLRDGAVRARFVVSASRLYVKAHVGRSPMYQLSLGADRKSIMLQSYDAGNKATTLLLRPLATPVAIGQEVELELRIVGQTLTAKLNGEVMGTKDGARLDAGAIGVGTLAGSAEPALVKSLEYLDLSAATASSPSAPQEKWVNRLDEWFNKPNPVVTKLSRLPDGAHVEAGEPLPVFTRPARDAAVRVTMRDSSQGVMTLYLRSGNGRSYAAGFEPKGGTVSLFRFRTENEKPESLARATLPASFDPQTKQTFEFRAEGDRLTFLVDGKPVVEQHDSTYTEGGSRITFPVGGIIEKLEYAILDAPSGSETAPATQENWIDLIAETLERSERSKLTRLPEGTRIDGSFGFGAGRTPHDSVVRAVVLDAAQGFSVNLRSNGKIGNSWKQYHFYLTATGQLVLYMEDADKHELARKALAGFDPKAKHIFEFRAVGDRLTASVDGRPVINAQDATYSAGSFAFSAEGAVFEKIEYLILDR